MKRVVIVHGFSGSPEKDWFPWLRHELDKRGFIVVIPVLPHPMHPEREAWHAALTHLVGSVDENTIFVTHSLGTLATLHYIESLPEGTRCGGLVAVAPFVEPHIDILFPHFFNTQPRYDILRERIPLVEVFADRQDRLAPFHNAEHLVTELGCTLTECHGRGHFNEIIDHVTEVPEVLEAVLRMEKHKTTKNTHSA